MSIFFNMPNGKNIATLLLAFFFFISAYSFDVPGDEETEANLLIPLENLVDTDPRVYRTSGLDGLPAVGIKRGIEIVVPYRIYLPRKFYRNFAILASIRPADHLGGFLFAVLNAFDTVVELGLQLQPMGPSQINISLFYTDSQTERDSRVLASFLVPAFIGQWAQFALEVNEGTVGLYFRCMRFAIRQVNRRPAQLQMDDASKLYIANAGPILGGGFEGAIQELKLHDDPAEAANQCNENWDSERGGSDFGSGFGPPDEEKDRPHPPFRPLFPTTLPATMRTTIPTTTTMTTDAPMTEPEKSADRWMIGAAGPKGEKGDTGAPGTCAMECPMPPPGPPGLPGPPGPPGKSPILTESDIRRIAQWPGVKGEKGERGSRGEEDGEGQEVVLLNGQRSNGGAGGYESGGKTHAEKGQKGDKGDRGMPGPPGRPGTPTQQPPQPQQTQQRAPVAATVSVYQTALELLAGTPQCPVGTLAFALSTQQLFLRVHSGWRQVLLDKTVTTDPQQLQQQQQQASTSAHSVLLDSAMDPELSRLAYWLALDEPNGSREDYEGAKGRPEAEGAFGGLIPPPANPAPPSPEAQPWRARWPSRDLKVNEERELGRQRTAETETDRIVPRHKDRVIHLMALNEPLSGNFGGVRGADLECYRQARQTGFSTTFRAFLSSRVQDLNKIVHMDDRRHTPVVNLLGERLFDSWHAVFDGGAHAHVPLYSFNRRDVFSHWDWTDRWVWHGSSSDGLRSLAYCSEWRSSNSAAFGMASPLHSKHSLTDQSREVSCSRKLAVLCVEVMSKYSVDKKLGKPIMSDLRF